MSDPYKVLGVSRDASMDEIKKAYRNLSRKYHPDANINNPNKEKAEEMFKLVQQAYEQIVDERERGSSSGSYGGFGGFSGRSQNTAGSDEESLKYQAAANYLNNGHIREAMNVLDGMRDRGAMWYYLHAIANSRMGNNVNAVEDARRAVALEPDNQQYQMLLHQLENGGQWYTDMGQGYGYERQNPSAGNWCCQCLALNMCCGGCGVPCCCCC